MKNTSGSTRREFLKRSAAASTALGAPMFIPAHVLGRDSTPSASETVIIGLIGVGKNKRVCQVGSQQRTMEINRFCCEYVRDGKLGKIKQVSAVNYPGPKRYKGLLEEPVPATDDWKTWCGPTELRPFNNKLQF